MNPFPTDPAPFDLAATKTRVTDVARTMIKTMMMPAEAERILDDPAAQKRISEQVLGMVTDSMASTSEIQRLYDRFEDLKRRHMPFAGDPGAPAKCTTCSLHGAEVAWPCEVYTFADASLPKSR